MNLAKYNEIIEKIEKYIIEYEKNSVYDNKVILYLANGEQLNIRFPSSGIAHLLGVDIEYLKLSSRFPRGKSTYEYLKYFIENSYSFAKIIFSEKKLSIDKVFSKNIEGKLASFWENTHIRLDDLIAVVKYDREKIYQSDLPVEVSDYFIIRKILGNYYVLGLKRNEDRGIAYVPTTSRKYDDYLEFENFMSRISYKQELTYANKIKINNISQKYSHNFWISEYEKIEKLDYLIKQGKKYSSTVSVGNDFLNYLRKNKLNTRENETNLEMLLLLRKSIKKRKIIDPETIKKDTSLSETIKELITISNNLITIINNLRLNNTTSPIQASKTLKKTKNKETSSYNHE